MGIYKQTTALRKISKLKKRIWSLPGSQGASKTISILMLLINHAASNKNKEIYIVSAEFTKLKLTCIKDFLKIMKDFDIFDEKNWVDGSLYKFDNGSFIKFFGADKIDSGKGLRSDIVFFNEANKMKFEFYRELSSRALRIILDYNPNKSCWIQEEIETREDCQTLKLTWRDNEYLSEAEREEIKSYKYKAFNEDGSIKNNYWYNIWRVYSEGLTGSLSGVIFQNWEIGEFNNELSSAYGLDFGASDPDACVKVAIDRDNKIIYVKEIIYQNNLSTNDLIKLLKERIEDKKLIIADSSAKRTIDDIESAGFNIRGVEKNKIVDDIKLLQGYKIIITSDSINLKMELENYVWLDTKSDTPCDAFNHLIDSLRYIVQTLLEHKQQKTHTLITSTNNQQRTIQDMFRNKNRKKGVL